MTTQPPMPMPERLDPKPMKGSLYASVKRYFYPLFNEPESEFSRHLASTSNRDAVRGNHLFDRARATELMRKAAKEANDPCFDGVDDGAIYQCITRLIRNEQPVISIKRRRELLTQTQRHAAE